MFHVPFVVKECSMLRRVAALLCLVVGGSILMSTADAFSSEAISQSVFPEMKLVYQEELKPHVDVTAGVFNPEGSYSSGSEFGVGFGFQPYTPFDAGMALTFSSSSSKYEGTRALERTTVLFRGAYRFGGTNSLINHSYVGAAAGPVIERDATYVALAPIAGFDLPIREWSGDYLSSLSVGIEGRYMIVSSNESDGLSVNGTMKYWF